MKIIDAKVLDPTHLELTRPIAVAPGESIRIAIPEEGEDTGLWTAAARTRFLEAYDESDAIYDRR